MYIIVIAAQYMSNSSTQCAHRIACCITSGFKVEANWLEACNIIAQLCTSWLLYRPYPCQLHVLYMYRTKVQGFEYNIGIAIQLRAAKGMYMWKHEQDE